MAEKGLNRCEECTARCPCLYPDLSFWGDNKIYTSIVNSEEINKKKKKNIVLKLTKRKHKQNEINKNSAITKVKVLVEKVILRDI